ncbi:hypothetical protein MAR_017680 [Mya arenaria]|uniref:RRM domain-containing protein n=1 Tax=Mya arenaria TaxID=6604 RepID=A0ABY7EFX9_MYAAR|nr:uncharacterized protein LOC128236889 [Mya arenaria]WAR07722.1 hypothetical protein MAR_017680 [Mya arenaria]
MIFIANYLLVQSIFPILAALLTQGDYCNMDEHRMKGSASTVVVTGLENNIKKSNMEKRFKKVGQILGSDLRPDRGTGIVVFKTQEEAQRAIQQLSEHEGNDVQMRVQSAETFYREQIKKRDGDFKDLVNKAERYYTTLPRTKETIQFENNRAWQVWKTEDLRTRGGGGGMGGQGGGMGIFKGQDGQPGESGPGGKGGEGGKGGGGIWQSISSFWASDKTVDEQAKTTTPETILPDDSRGGGGAGGKGGSGFFGFFKGEDGRPGEPGPNGRGGRGGGSST